MSRSGPPAPAHEHDDPRATVARHERRAWAVAALAVAATVVELGGGWLTGSSALLAEALHMGAHVGAFVLAGVAYAASRLFRRSRPRLARAAPDLAALVNGVLLLSLGTSLATESLEALRQAHPVAYGPALALALFGLLVNGAAAALLHHDHAHETGHGRDMNFRAIYLHVIGDLAVALLAVVGLVLGRSLGWRWTDPVAGMLGATLVIVLGAQVSWRSLRYLAGGRDRERAAQALHPAAKPRH